VITGTTSSRKLSTDALAAKSTATVVILMGMSKLDEIVALFQNESRRNARSHYSKWDYARGKVGGTIDTIQETVAVNKLSSPAIIVIGEVVGDSKKEQVL
jgi:uroporphyrin-III C-methyltransferase